MAYAEPGNDLITLLPVEEQEKMLPHLEQLDIAVRQEVFQANRPIEHGKAPACE